MTELAARLEALALTFANDILRAARRSSVDELTSIAASSHPPKAPPPKKRGSRYQRTDYADLVVAFVAEARARGSLGASEFGEPRGLGRDASFRVAKLATASGQVRALGERRGRRYVPAER